MNKYFCDRCGKEIGPVWDVTTFKVSANMCRVGDVSYTRDLCHECADKVMPMLEPPEDDE